ncbi:precorrin-4 C(11)-methyltransferase [Dysgonomonas sp. Marseille-P4677]|uniref:precorrin-4 C(11)-methyltransferase n=1 Tax=Dysgonomonas sp. Marseille-P4677 TaxID=2364790 RepID=UPI001914CE91|nr:precorrin-4 C(11)-methyltransferase [Dysgonomonas sp. Marseille-P4677]MBK5720381.1 precorrin-4 C(11)-methyltransferase [Dysgonomonas sp. Marseille-P4677]
MRKNAIILTSESSLPLAQTIKRELIDTDIYTKEKLNETIQISSIRNCIAQIFNETDAIIFIGAMGICIRSIAPYIRDKHTDPAIINIDSTGRFVISVLSGHVGGANDLTKEIARIIGGEAIITTQSDNTNLWSLDTIGEKYGWKTKSNTENFNHPLTTFVNRKPTALLLDIRDDGTIYLERSKPEHVDIYYKYSDINMSLYELFIAVTPYSYPPGIQTIYYHPKVLHLGMGCRKDCNPDGIAQYIENEIKLKNIAIESIKDISTIDIKKDEALLKNLQFYFGQLPVHIYTANELTDIDVPNPSEKVKEVTSVNGVSESTAIRSSDYGILILEKQKGVLSQGNDFTFAIAIDRTAIRQGHIEIVGAGPGDPDLISVRGRQFLEAADLILYAGSLVPKELTYCAKGGAIVRSSASMDLEEQFAIMKEFYDKGNLVARLHTGDPCIYGAIQEQMAYFDEHNMVYHITPGISSFQAAAAALKSQFTIPEKVQTIILTRGEGRTPMPDKEKLSLLARSQSTMCIFLSATVVDDVQKDLLEHYPPTTPVAACYKLTWKDERIYRGQLKDLAKIVRENNLTLTTMIVVGDSIDNRRGLSKLYSHQFKHLFRR